MEDNRADLFLIRETIAAAHLDADLHIALDGEAAIRFFEQADRDPSAPRPALVILDINLPKRSGLEVIHRMRQSRSCANAPVVVVTSSDSERDRDQMGKLGIKAYFCKPSEYAHFMQLGELLKRLLEETAESPSPDR